MITLDSTTKVLQAVLAGAVSSNQPQANVVFSDENIEGIRTKYASQQTNLNSTTDVTICSATQQNFIRNIEHITIYNKDTATIDLTLKIDDGGTETILYRQTLLTLETFVYEHGAGAQII